MDESRAVYKVAYEQIFKTANLDKRKTKIIATLGPQSRDAAQIVKLLDNGMNIARVDLANGDIEANEAYIEELNKALMMRATKTCAVMVDLTGPSIRTGKNKDNQVINISIGQSLKIVSDMTVEGDGLTISTSYPLLSQYQRSDILG
jgi:pyruvate kinase